MNKMNLSPIPIVKHSIACLSLCLLSSCTGTQGFSVVDKVNSWKDTPASIHREEIEEYARSRTKVVMVSRATSKTSGKLVDGGQAVALTEDGYYLTALHVLNKKSPFLFIRTPRKDPVTLTACRIVWTNKDLDLAILQAEERPQKTFLPEYDRAKDRDAVVAASLFGSFSYGQVHSTIRGNGNAYRVIHSAPSRKGDSGSGLLSSRNRLVGITTATVWSPFHFLTEGISPDWKEIWAVIEEDRKKPKRPILYWGETPPK
ncbi:MAG: trypsin-like peptidase domain-containing protein [Verrucomicrobiae bacterium]|nr:trypsin-like peptidase domain-containing protein [Verrucomicrobiae bacterium]